MSPTLTQLPGICASMTSNISGALVSINGVYVYACYVRICLGARVRIDLGILSISKQNGFDNEALTKLSEKSAEWIDRCTVRCQHG